MSEIQQVEIMDGDSNASMLSWGQSAAAGGKLGLMALAATGIVIVGVAATEGLVKFCRSKFASPNLDTAAGEKKLVVTTAENGEQLVSAVAVKSEEDVIGDEVRRYYIDGETLSESLARVAKDKEVESAKIRLAYSKMDTPKKAATPKA